jgi:hypothetical protein
MATLRSDRFRLANLNRFGEVVALTGGGEFAVILQYPGQAPRSPLGSEEGSFPFSDQVNPIGFVLPTVAETLGPGQLVAVRSVSMVISQVHPVGANGFCQVDFAIPTAIPSGTRYR